MIRARPEEPKTPRRGDQWGRSTGFQGGAPTRVPVVGINLPVCDQTISVNTRLLLCTCPDSETAGSLAAALVSERLAACVNVITGLRSVYRWHGTIEQAEESLLLIKTAADRQPALTARLQALHPYELPEIIAVEIAGGLPAYLDWIVAQTRSTPAGPAVTDPQRTPP